MKEEDKRSEAETANQGVKEWFHGRCGVTIAVDAERELGN